METEAPFDPVTAKPPLTFYAVTLVYKTRGTKLQSIATKSVVSQGRNPITDKEAIQLARDSFESSDWFKANQHDQLWESGSAVPFVYEGPPNGN